MQKSSTAWPDLFAALTDPFDPAEVKQRTQAGRTLHYITARTAMNRLDEVLGPENWWDEYHAGENSVLCRLTVRLPDGSILTKCDAGGYAGMADQGDDDKSGYSDAFKRACVKFGVARYLYRDGTADFGDREASPPEAQPAPPKAPARVPGSSASGLAPTTGVSLYAWAKKVQEHDDFRMVDLLADFGQSRGYPGKVKDWDATQVLAGFTEGMAQLRKHAGTETAKPAEPEPLPDPGSIIPRPANGKELFKTLSDLQRDRGVTLLGPVIEWTKKHDLGQLVSLTGDDLDQAWRYAAWLIPKDELPKLNRDVWNRCKYLLKLYAPDVKPDPDMVLGKINEVYGSLYPGETIESFREFRETDRLEVLDATLAELVEERANGVS